jgi:membrane protease YdiL (CAAX protease family)
MSEVFDPPRADGAEADANGFLAYARRGRNSWWRFLLCLVLAAVLTMVIGIGLGVVLFLAGLLPPDLAAQMTKPTAPAPFFISIGVTFGLVVAALAVSVLIAHAKRPTLLLGQWRWRHFAFGAGVWALICVASALIDEIAAPGTIRLSVGPQTLPLAGFALLGLGAQTFAEEYVFRGYLTQQVLLAIKRPLPCALISAALFGSAHIPNGAPQALAASLFGLATALIAIRLGGLAFTWGLHLINNLFGAVVVVSASDVFRGSPGVFSQNAPQLLWWDVGVEAAALCLVVWLVLRWTQAPRSWLVARM